MTDWKPIETAPKDGTKIILCCMKANQECQHKIGKVAVDWWREKYQYSGLFNQAFWPATHWMPLPQLPMGET